MPIKLLYTQERKKNDQIATAIFNESLELLWEKLVDLPYVDSKLFVRDIHISNNGENVFLIGAYAQKVMKSEYEYKIFHITKNEQKEYAIDLKGELSTTSLGILSNEKGQVINLVGLYKNQLKANLDGVYSLSINTNTGMASDILYNNFTQEERTFFNRKIRLESFRKSGKGAIYSINNMKQLSNGNLQCIVECRKAKFRPDGSAAVDNYGYEIQRVTMDTHSSWFQEILFITLDKKGVLLNTAVIAREYASYDIPGYSINSRGDKSYVIVQSKVTKSQMKKYGIEKSFRNTLSKLVVIDADGNITADQLLFTTLDRDKGMLFYDILSSIHDGHLIVGGVLSTLERSGKVDPRKLNIQFGRIKN